MTRDELIEAIRLQISPLTQCPKYRHPCSVDEKETCRCYAKDVETAKRIIASIEAQGLAVVPVVASAELAEKAFPIPPKAHRNACVVRLHEHANKMRREDYDAMIQAGRL